MKYIKTLGLSLVCGLLAPLYAASNMPQTAMVPAPLPPAAQCAANGQDYATVVAFAQHLKQAVKDKKPQDFAALGAYPVRVNQGLHHFIILKNKEALVKSYSIIMTPKMQKAILNQGDAKIFCNAQGAFVGNGAIWFRTTTDDFGFFVINAF
jgi:hypothetical protein